MAVTNYEHTEPAGAPANQLEDSLIKIAVESWRFSRLFARLEHVETHASRLSLYQFDIGTEHIGRLLFAASFYGDMNCQADHRGSRNPSFYGKRRVEHGDQKETDVQS